MSGDQTIRCSDNGPYIVTGLERFTTAEGEAIEVRPVMALCRCGGSENKPFCDGTHASIAFTGDKLDGRIPDKRDTYEAGHITIYDNRGICSHAGYCTTDCPAIFLMGEEPWIDADGSTPDRIIETIKECPSGALSYALSGEEYRDQDRAPSITVSKDGPYRVVGGVDLEAQEWGEGASREHFALCRCGGSKNKPFCDGTHWSIDFKDPQDGAATSASADGDETELTWYRVGDVDVVPEGRVMTLVAGSQHQVAVTTVDGKHAALCNRCPHQGGPLGEGTIENGRLRCPWHGWDFDPLTGESVDGFVDHVDTYPCEVRDDGLYVDAVPGAVPATAAATVNSSKMRLNWMRLSGQLSPLMVRRSWRSAPTPSWSELQRAPTDFWRG